MTKEQFKKNVDVDIDKLVKLAMARYNNIIRLTEGEETEEEADEEIEQEEDVYGYEDDLKDRYNDAKGWK